MNRSRFAWERWLFKLGRRRDGRDGAWLLGLFLAALLLLGLNLGTLPLTTGEEASVARITREALSVQKDAWGWLWPTRDGQLLAGYSPIAHGLVALLYRWGGVNPAMTRWPGALLAAISVPLFYALAREAFPSRTPAEFAALIYLLFWPAVRQGRFAVLDGPVLCGMLWTIWCALRCRRDWRWSWGLGMGLGLLLLTQAVSCLLGALLVGVFVAWDTPRLLRSRYAGLGVALGIAPALAWCVACGFSGVLPPGLESATAPTAMALLGAALASLPTLPFCWSGLQRARTAGPWSWTKLVGVWCSFYLLLAPLLAMRFSVSLLPLYPALAAAGGAALAEASAGPSSGSYPRGWAQSAIATALGFAGFCLYLVLRGADASTITLFASVALTLAVVAALIERQDRQFTVMLFWGLYVGLLLMACSPYWTQDLKFWIEDSRFLASPRLPEMANDLFTDGLESVCAMGLKTPFPRPSDLLNS